MASRLDQFQEFVLTFQSPWNLAGKTDHRWSQSFYVSGTIEHSAADAEAAALMLASPALLLASNRTSLVQFNYYPAHSLVSTVVKIYAPGDHPGTAGAYDVAPQAAQQLEVAAVAHCPIGKNTRGKEIYLRKYFHDVVAHATDPNSLSPLVDAATLLAPFNTGSGPHSVVPCSPVSGATGGPWTMESHVFTHQLRKGKKKKKVPAPLLSSVISDLVNAGLDAASALALARKILA